MKISIFDNVRKTKYILKTLNKSINNNSTQIKDKILLNKYL